MIKFIRFIFKVWNNRHLIDKFNMIAELENGSAIIKSVYYPNGNVKTEYIK